MGFDLLFGLEVKSLEPGSNLIGLRYFGRPPRPAIDAGGCDYLFCLHCYWVRFELAH